MHKHVINVIFLAFFMGSSPTGVAQKLLYIDHTGDKETQLDVRISQKADTREVMFTDPETYSLHVFEPQSYTKRWDHKDYEHNHNFTALREGNRIRIKGTFKGEPVEKVVEIDEKRWINKLDHGLSAWVTSKEEEVVFWALKLSSDLDPIEFRAEKIQEEKLNLASKTYDAVKVKLSLNGMVLSRLWSAYCWYDKKTGLFLKFEGTQGPGSPLTTITLNTSPNP
ncbi:hypothetical protein PZB74_00285 [Porifericola rhodea]|uniref:hypothetical protein n=1 Tax=Porifericola rhodea TaxID=930972 RepID=UPI00266604EE|nr:hypothetical protein [Porifericola rhodea]WKN31795.1 hypothetical protein PZB74_00285 [Porifericola rhodea]